MKLLLDFFPIILFFIAYKTFGLYAAIYVMIAAISVQLLIGFLRTGTFEKAHLIGFVLLILFGSITLYFRNPAFVMWKVSVLYLLFAALIIGSLWIGDKTILQRTIGKELNLPTKVWQQLTWLWGLGFVLIAVINGYYVKMAIFARDALFANTQLSTTIELTNFNCQTISAKQLCLTAQQTEASWVNFKLFTTMGLTFLLLLISMAFIAKYIKK